MLYYPKPHNQAKNTPSPKGCHHHYKPLPMMTAYKNLGWDIKGFPNAYKLYENAITLPLHTKLSDEDVDYIIANFSEIVKEYTLK